jgi:hypothetical protein
MKTNPTIPPVSPASGPRDEHGPVPSFRAGELDARGKLVPLSPLEDAAWRMKLGAALRAIESLPDDDPPGTAEAIMRGIDSHRDADCKLFEGMY